MTTPPIIAPIDNPATLFGRYSSHEDLKLEQDTFYSELWTSFTAANNNAATNLIANADPDFANDVQSMVEQVFKFSLLDFFNEYLPNKTIDPNSATFVDDLEAHYTTYLSPNAAAERGMHVNPNLSTMTYITGILLESMQGVQEYLQNATSRSQKETQVEKSLVQDMRDRLQYTVPTSNEDWSSQTANKVTGKLMTVFDSLRQQASTRSKAAQGMLQQRMDALSKGQDILSHVLRIYEDMYKQIGRTL